MFSPRHGRRFHQRERPEREKQSRSKQARYRRQTQQDNTLGQLPHPVVRPVMKILSQTAPPSWQVRVQATGKIGIAISPTGTNPTSLEALVSRQVKTLRLQTVSPIPDTVEDICSDIDITVEERDAPEGRSSKGAPGG